MVAVSFVLRYHPDVKVIDIPLLDAKLKTFSVPLQIEFQRGM